MCGLSTVFCPGWFTSSLAITSTPGPARDAPSPFSGAAHTRDTAGEDPSLFFQCSHGLPSASTNGIGSIEPPRSAWQTSGPADESVNGPAGDDATATLRQYFPFER